MSGYQISKSGFPKEYGLYDPQNEHENCGLGFIANIQNQPKHEIVHQALEIVHNLDHRGAVGSDPLAGDGAGISRGIVGAAASGVLAAEGILKNL